MPLQSTPYRLEEFVNRESEISLVRNKLVEAKERGWIDRPIVHFYGVPHIGKTWLMQHLALLTYTGVFVVSVDCDAAACSKVPRDMLRRECEGSQIFRDESLKIPVLLLLDAADALHEEDFHWLEKEILVPLACTDQAVIVVSGQRDTPKWRQVETRRRVCYHALNVFAVNETSELLRKAELSANPKQVYEASGGHPGVSRQIAASSCSVNDVLAEAESELMRDIPSEWQDVVRMISVLRFFNIGTLREFLSQVIVDQAYEERSDAFYIELLDVMQLKSGWLSHSAVGYYMSSFVRNLFWRRLRQIDPDVHYRAHKTAIDILTNNMYADSNSTALLLSEAIYHQAILTTLPKGSISDLQQFFTDRLDSTRFPASHVEQLRNNIEEITQELELRESIYLQVCEIIRQEISRFTQSIRMR